MVSTESGMVIEVKLVHELKALLLMVVTELPKSIVKPEASSEAP